MPPSKLVTHHIALKVQDLNLSQNFYEKILGLEVMGQQKDNAGKLRSVWLKSGEVILMLEHEPKLYRGGTDEGWFLVAWKIEAGTRKAWCDLLLSHNIWIENESDYTVYFRDPEGNRNALSHFPEKSSERVVQDVVL